MFIVINGGGKVGSYLGRTLAEEGHDVAVIEQEPAILGKLTNELPSRVLLIEGDGCNLKAQEDAGVEHADVFVAVTGDDEDNLVSCQLARARFEVKRVVARVNSPKNEPIFEALGILAVSATTVIGRLIEERTTAGEVLTVHVLSKGGFSLVEIVLPPESGAETRRPVAELRLPERTVLVAVVRGDEVIVPRGNTVMQPADRVIAMTPVAHEKELRRVLTGVP